MKSKILLLLILITFFGLLLRTYNLTDLPAGFFCDEASTGYNAYLVLKTGHDEFGKRLPVFFESFGNFRPGVPFYTTIPFVFLLGLNELSTRLPAALIGTATIVVLFFLVRLLFKSEKIALLSAFLLAISPWHIHFSRYGAENIYLPFFTVLGIFLFLYGLSKKNNKIFLISFAVFGLGLYTYFQAFFLIPLFLSFLLISKWKIISKKHVLLGLLIFVIFSTPLILGTKSGEIFGRLTQVSSANKDKNLTTISLGMATTYKDHFLPEFLFSKGDIDYHTHFISRFSVKGMGQLYWFQLPFILFSFLFLKKHKYAFSLIIFWLIIYPLGSTMAPFADGGGPFATRSIIGVIPFQILTAVGIFYFLKVIKNKIIRNASSLLLITVISISFYNYAFLFFVEYPKYSSDFWGWQFGARDIMKYYMSNQNYYDELIFPTDFNAPDIFPKFYGKGECYKCIVGLPETYLDPSKKQLYSLSPEYIQKNNINLITLKYVFYPNGNVAFQIGEIVK